MQTKATPSKWQALVSQVIHFGGKAVQAFHWLAWATLVIRHASARFPAIAVDHDKESGR